MQVEKKRRGGNNPPPKRTVRFHPLETEVVSERIENCKVKFSNLEVARIFQLGPDRVRTILYLDADLRGRDSETYKNGKIAWNIPKPYLYDMLETYQKVASGEIPAEKFTEIYRTFVDGRKVHGTTNWKGRRVINAGGDAVVLDEIDYEEYEQRRRLCLEMMRRWGVEPWWGKTKEGKFMNHPFHMRVDFSQNEIETISNLARSRQEIKARNRSIVSDKRISGIDNVLMHRVGIMGEYAVAKILGEEVDQNSYIAGQPFDFLLGDCKIEVKTYKGDLLVQKLENLVADCYVLVNYFPNVFNYVIVQGWTTPAQWRRFGEIRTIGERGPHFCFPTRKLYAVSTLRPHCYE